MNLSQTNIPMFKGENYNLWSLKMKTLFRSRDLWGLVEKGVGEEEDEHHLSENQKKDAKALFLIQQALDERGLVWITEAQTSKQAWDILKQNIRKASKSLL